MTNWGSNSDIFSKMLEKLPSLPPSIKDYTVPLTASIAIGLSLPIIVAFRRNYHEWRAMGDNGVPSSPSGWTMNWILTPFGREELSPKIYDDPKVKSYHGNLATTSFLHIDLPQRAGERPVMAPFTVPQRQYPIGFDEKLQKLEVAELEAIAAANAKYLRIGISRIEKHGPALWLQDDVPHQPFAWAIKGEIAHIHVNSECSAHVTLSTADAKEVMEKGWGRRHALSGSVIPASYLFIYAPRNEEEVKILGQILRAGARFMTNGKEIL